MRVDTEKLDWKIGFYCFSKCMLHLLILRDVVLATKMAINTQVTTNIWAF